MTLEVRDLHGGYGQSIVVRGIDFTLETGGRLGLFGPNGNGKTTLLRLISGLLRPRGGRVVLDGREISGLPPPAIVDLGLIHVPQGNALFPRLSVRDNLQLGAYSRRTWSKREKRLARVFELFPILHERESQPCRTLSGGQRQMLAIGVGLMADPVVLMLDEPTLGLAPKVKEVLRTSIATIAATGVSLLVVDQDVELLLDLTDRLLFIEQGRVASETTGSDLDNPEIAAMYFGTRPA